MADILANYVKFLRGTPTAYNNLVKKDVDTLYFVAEKNSTIGKLYLGNVCISDSLNEEGLVDYLSELKDVDTAGAIQNSVLGFDTKKQQWIPMNIESLISISNMIGATAEAAGSAGLVPAPNKGQENKFLRGDGSWSSTAQVFEVETLENETCEQAINRVIGSVSLNIGDFVVVKHLNETISYIYNGLKWAVINDSYLEYIKQLQGAVNDITDSLTGDDGLQKQFDDIQTEFGTVKTDLRNKANSSDVYTKNEADLVIASQIAAIDHLKRKIVNNYNDIQDYIDNHDDADKYIFMVPTIYQYTGESNKYDEYIVLKTIDENDFITYSIESVGSWSVDLENYYTKSQIDTALSDKVDKIIYQIPVVDENGNPVYEDDGVTQKMEKVEGALLSPTDKQKLDILVIGDGGNIEISGKVNASNVEGLSEWVVQNRDKVDGLYPTAAAQKLEGIQEDAEKNFITTVEESQFTVTNGELGLASGITKNLSDLSDASTLHTTRIDSLDKALNGYTDENGEQVQGLVATVNDFANTYVAISDFKSVVGDLNQMKSQGVNLWNDIQAIQEVLTWQTMTE